jgi:hypothetical protein
MMFVAGRAKRRIRAVLVICLTYAAVVAAVASFFPRESRSFAASYAWWLLAIPVFLIGYAALEVFGEWFLDLAFWSRMPSWARVLLLVLIISFVSASVILVRASIGSHGVL